MPTDQPHTTPAGACHGACNHAARQALAAYQRAIEEHADAIDAWVAAGQPGEPPAEPEPPTIRWNPGSPLFCGRCLANTRRALLELDTLAGMLAAHSDGHRTPTTGEGRVSGTKTTPSVSPTADILDRLVGDLFDVEDEWRAERGYPPRQSHGARGAHPRSRTIGWLAERLEEILAHPDFVALPRRVHNWERVLRRLAKDDRAASTSPVRCSCGERRIAWDTDLHYYRCRSCGTLWNVDEHDRLIQEQADAAETAGSTA